MMRNRRFYIELNGKKSRWCNQKNGLPEGSVLSPVLFNVYTKDQSVHNETRSFIYADDLCIASQRNTFELSYTKWGAKPATIKTTALALCYSTVEYVCPVWERSKHVSKLTQLGTKRAAPWQDVWDQHLLRMYISLLVLHYLVSEGIRHLDNKEECRPKIPGIPYTVRSL